MKVISNSLKRFINLETKSSILLFFCSILAILIANSAWGDFYQEFWHHNFTIGFADTDFHLSKSLILWINDGLMAIFFFVIGLEVKRELMVGELTTLRKASLPFFAAVGGMFFPVMLFLFLMKGNEGAEGWGIPMATDIAFTLGVLKILGNRVPIGLKIFLTAFAIVDDIGAVLVIALFYSSNVQWNLMLYALSIYSLLVFLSYKKVYSVYFFFFAGFIIWLLFLKSGIHPTIGGILMAFVIPIRQRVAIKEYIKLVSVQFNIFKSGKPKAEGILSVDQIQAIDRLEALTEKVHSPLQSLEHRLHGWVSYLIMPIFAFANAGVVLNFGDVGPYSYISTNIALALVFGNSIGITAMVLFAIKLKLANLPDQVSLTQILGVSFLGGLGFTMSLFIANLAYTDAALVDASKMGIIIGSFAAGLIGYLILRFSGKSVSG